MKKLLSICALAAFLFLTPSCNSDDEGGASTNNENLVVGNWLISEIDFEFTDESGTTSETFSTSSCNVPFEISFSQDGTFVYPDAEIEIDEDNDGNTSLLCNITNSNVNGTWQLVSANSYVFNFGSESDNVEISFSNNNNTINIALFNDQTDDPFDPFAQTITLIGNRN